VAPRHYVAHTTLSFDTTIKESAMRFQNQVAVVTGAASGIGEAAALAFAREGAAVALVDNDQVRGTAIVQQMRDAGQKASLLLTDVAEESQIRAVVDQVKEQWGRLDVLVNNVGIYLQADVTGTSLEEWDKLLRVNLTSAFLFTKYAVPVMADQGGVIVNVASEAGLVGIKGQVAYNVSKAAMIGLTRSCAVDLVDKGIRVNCLCPGTTETPLVHAALQRASDPAATRRQLESVRPLDRLGTSEEQAAAILYLASAEAGYATGAILSVDGGYTAQ
jgi:NAD(P)-dependent dehydrogenase (short-subunit alcohol dehydrogenase family)